MSRLGLWCNCSCLGLWCRQRSTHKSLRSWWPDLLSLIGGVLLISINWSRSLYCVWDSVNPKPHQISCYLLFLCIYKRLLTYSQYHSVCLLFVGIRIARRTICYTGDWTIHRSQLIIVGLLVKCELLAHLLRSDTCYAIISLSLLMGISLCYCTNFIVLYIVM